MRRRYMNKMIAVDELAAFVLSQQESWGSFIEHLKNGGEPDKHIMYIACFITDNMDVCFKTEVIENHPEINTSDKYDRWYNFDDDLES